MGTVYIPRLGHPVTAGQSGSGKIITRQSLRQWISCLRKKSSLRMCGNAPAAGHLSRVLEAHGYDVRSTDLIYRGYGEAETIDFLKAEGGFDGDIITNPPYKYALEFVKKALQMVGTGRKVAMFLKLTFLEGRGRKQFFLENPPKTVYVSSSRLICAVNGNFKTITSSAVAYAWFVWEKGFAGEPVIRWIN